MQSCVLFGPDWFGFLEDAGLKGMGWQCVTEDVESLWKEVFFPNFSSELATPQWDTYVPGAVAVFDVIYVLESPQQPFKGGIVMPV